MAFNCPPKYQCKTIKVPSKEGTNTRVNANNVTDSDDNSINFTEFVGMAYSSSPELTYRPFNKYKHTRNFDHHKHRLNKLSQICASNGMKETFNHSLFKETRCHSLYKTMTNKFYKLPNYEQITMLWLLNVLQERMHYKSIRTDKPRVLEQSIIRTDLIDKKEISLSWLHLLNPTEQEDMANV